MTHIVGWTKLAVVLFALALPVVLVPLTVCVSLTVAVSAR